LRWSSDGGTPVKEIVRQQWNFSPSEAICEVEEYRVELSSVAVLELVINPNIGDGPLRRRSRTFVCLDFVQRAFAVTSSPRTLERRAVELNRQFESNPLRRPVSLFLSLGAVLLESAVHANVPYSPQHSFALLSWAYRSIPLHRREYRKGTTVEFDLTHPFDPGPVLTEALLLTVLRLSSRRRSRRFASKYPIPLFLLFSYETNFQRSLQLSSVAIEITLEQKCPGNCISAIKCARRCPGLHFAADQFGRHFPMTTNCRGRAVRIRRLHQDAFRRSNALPVF